MKLKYYLRGLGIGIVFCGIVALFAYSKYGNNHISDEEIIKRAEKLGMAMTTEAVVTTEQATTENKKIVATSQDAMADNTKTTEKVKETTTEIVTEQTTEDTTETTEAKTTETKTTETKKEETDLVKATITVTGGMSSLDVAKMLQDAGIISDYIDFDNYLNQNGYSTQIRIKSCELTNKMSYEEIAKILIKEVE